MSDMKKLLESMDRLMECPPMEGGEMPPTPTNPGNPVTMSVSLNASGMDHVADLMKLLKQAGLEQAGPAAAPIMPMRMDMERLRNIVDEPEMEADGAYGDAIADDLDLEEYDNEPNPEYQDHKYMTKDLSGGLNREKGAYAAAQPGDNAMAVEGAPDLSPKFIKHLQVTFGDKEILSSSEIRKIEDMIDKMSIENLKTLVSADIPNVSDIAKDYLRNNTPGGMKNYSEDDGDTTYTIRGKSPQAQSELARRANTAGDEDMVEAIKKTLMAALSEKKAKPDFLDVDGDGDKKEPMKKALADKKKAGSKPKKGEVPPQFKKKK
jgi:hypothetical protein